MNAYVEAYFGLHGDTQVEHLTILVQRKQGQKFSRIRYPPNCITGKKNQNSCETTTVSSNSRYSITTCFRGKTKIISFPLFTLTYQNKRRVPGYKQETTQKNTCFYKILRMEMKSK